ncbi:UL16-binding protein 3 isoform X2 [Pipistrellus kuhlii]|uniref:UL16-binding protein 3 isoform X2 n=1 Tax=Pipistrellus kuhlii TaxID=59472 RepID=UPI001E27454C|nr:UL16-binding protein 3 isoform X2 [Pipistrellus kuhlii]
MARTPGPKFSLFLPPLAVLLVCVCAAPGASGRRDSHSPHYDFNISSDNQPWCMVQGKMDEEKYLFYDCGSNKVISMGLLGKEEKAIYSCKGELGTLSNMGNELKPLLPAIRKEKCADGAPLTLQVRMMCHGNTSGSLEFSLGGQRFLTFDSETEEYKADDSEGERLKKKWENNEDLNKVFNMTLKRDCKELYKCWVHRKTELETTAAPTTVPATATTTPTIASAAPTKTTVMLETLAILLIVLVISFILIIIRICYSNRKRWQRCCSIAPGSVAAFPPPAVHLLAPRSCSPYSKCRDLQEVKRIQQMLCSCPKFHEKFGNSAQFSTFVSIFSWCQLL